MKKHLSVFLAFLCLIASGCASAPPPAVSAPVSYESAVVSYLGPEGTYTQEACGIFFDRQGSYIPYKTVTDAVDALIRGESNYAVIPQENTIGGAVIDYVDTVIDQTAVSVVGEVELPINQNLLTLPDAEPEDIRTVYSHKQGIVQGKDWLKENLPHAQVIEVSSTAEGARMVAEARDPSCAAIASAACADVYELDIFASAIQNNQSNKTRFYVLSTDEPETRQAERLAFIAMGDAEHLPALMAEMEKQKAVLITIHDRPLKTELGQYSYLIECANSSYETYQLLTEKSDFAFRYLGSFDVR